MKTITVELHPDGTVKVAASGFAGQACRAATKPFLDLLGGEVVDDEVKAEAHAAAKRTQGLHQGDPRA